MCTPNIRDIVVEFDGEDLSKYGLFPLFAWYLNDVIRLPDNFAQISVNRKRNHNRKRRVDSPQYTDMQMCMGLVAISTLGIPRIYQCDDLPFNREANRTSDWTAAVLRPVYSP